MATQRASRGAAGRASYCEIYNETLFDLLNFTRTPLAERWDAEHGFTVPDLERRECLTLEDMRKVGGVRLPGTVPSQAAHRPQLSVNDVGASAQASPHC